MLASASPRRRELLRAAGFAFSIAVPDVDESALCGEPDREGASNAAARTRHERCLSLEPPAHRVTAPREAEPTARAYFASTPRRMRGSGARHAQYVHQI